MADDQLYPATTANLDAAKDLLRANIRGLTDLRNLSTARLNMLPVGSIVHNEVQIETRFLATQLEFNASILALIS